MLELLKIYAISKKVMSYVKAGESTMVICDNCGCEYSIELESCTSCGNLNHKNAMTALSSISR